MIKILGKLNKRSYFSTGCIKNRNLGDFFMFFRPEIFFKNPKNDPYRGNFMRGIDYAHFQRFLNPESGNRSVCIEAKIENFKIFCLKMTFWG